MKQLLIIFVLAFPFSSCNNERVNQLEAINIELKRTADSLSVELSRAQKEIIQQRKIAERQTGIALKQEQIAMHEAMRAKIAEESAYDATKRLNETKK